MRTWNLEIRRQVLNAEITKTSGPGVTHALEFLDLENSKINTGLRISKLLLCELTLFIKPQQIAIEPSY